MNAAEQLEPVSLSAPERYLVGDERAFITVRRHVSQLGRVIAETLGVWVLGIAIVGWLAPSLITDAAGFVMLASIVRLTWEIVCWRRTTITVSDKRLFMLSGVFTRRLSMLPLRKVTDMTLVQPLAGRLLGYGSIIVESAGQNQALSDIHFIPKPMRFYQLLASLVFDGSPAPGRGQEATSGRLDDTMIFEDL